MKNLKILFYVISIFISSFAFSQMQNGPDYGLENQHCIQLDNALMAKDLKELETILHSNLTLGHSNGWIETKESLLKNLPTSKVIYHQFLYQGTPEIHYQSNDLKSIRRNLTAIGSLEGKEFQVDLKILEVWILENNSWKLLARQSVEVDFDS